jgi:ABC transporter, phosphonate, periplasmic substrate-binding protein
VKRLRCQLLKLLLIGLCLAEWPVMLLADDAVKVAVLVFRPKPQAIAQWRPLAQALKKAIPERDFVIQVYDMAELEVVVASRQVDFVLTSPGHYISLSRRVGLQAPLATLLMEEGGSGDRRLWWGDFYQGRGIRHQLSG